jgi:surface antigen
MLRTVTQLVSVVTIAAVLSSCAAMDSVGDTVKDNPKAVLGSLIGGAAGVGIAAAAGGGAGAMLGAGLGGMLIGGLIGNRLDARDKRMAADAAQKAFESNQAGQASVWKNPDTGNSGTITPTRTTQLANGQYCREYKQTITVGGQQENSYGTACRQPDGSWKIQS